MSAIIDQSKDLDQLDYAILSLLQVDGRKSFTDVAKELDVAVNTVRYRVTKLVESGTLHFYSFVNPLDLGFNAIAEIQIQVSPSRLIEQVATHISELEEISFVVMVTGESDLLVEANCLDSGHLRELLNRLHQIEGVENTRTRTYLKVYKWHQPDLGKILERRSNRKSTEIEQETEGPKTNVHSR